MQKILILRSWKRIWFHSTITKRGSRLSTHFLASNLKWKMKREETSYKNCSPDERKSKTVLDSGFKVLDSDSLPLELGLRIPIVSEFPDSWAEFPISKPRLPDCAKKKNPGYWIPHLKNSRIMESGFLCLGRNCEENHCLESFRLKEFVFVKAKRTNAEPTYNEGPRDWQNLFAVSRFRYIRFFFIYFTITGLKKIVCYTEDIVM